MKLLISDANIFIDMEEGGLIEHMFRLPEEIGVPDILYLEELEERHSHLPGLGLRVMEIEAEYMAEAHRLKAETVRPPGMNDLFALALAKQEKCRLLTGDSRLREIADIEAVEVSGTLWLVERLFEEGLCTVEQIEIAYQQMKENARRLPWDIVDAWIKKRK